ncbi:MAG: 23S rRNA (uracil(1939)-C(5))-methyltransferase RlmD [Nitrospirae bacterium]|nr:23S rRNA (uracil(1939)-C(5))-methyltransferase RlmD [Nitrospirota bacterium]
MTVVKGTPLTVTIEKMVHGGRGMGRWDGVPVFIGGAIEGETIDAVVHTARKGYLEATSVRIVTASGERVEPPCPLVPRCGGCQLQHLAYRAQLEAKRAIVAESFRRLGRLAVDVPPLTPSPDVSGYRLRAGLKVGVVGGRRVLGFYASGSHAVVPVSSCLVLHPRLQAALGPLTDLLARSDRWIADLEEIEVQTTSFSEEVLVIFRMHHLDRRALGAIGRELQAVLPLRGLIAYDRQRHRWVGGADALEERIDARPRSCVTLDGIVCRVSDRTFLQINAGVNAALVAALGEWAALSGRERIIDLYAGFGNFSLPLARRASQVTLVESSRSAIDDARFNTRASGLPVRVVASPVESWTPDERDRHPDLVIVDPPRVGLSPLALDRLIALAPARLLYVSCEPATLARDAERLARSGYRLTRIRGFDMFPHTAHVELLAEFIGPPADRD